MLIQLSIRDIVLIERLDLAFETGLSVLTGETGAGKSILLDSLSLSRYCDKVSTPEYIGCKKRTQGTETSKYLQERTSTETPQVVASERGPGQWQL